MSFEAKKSATIGLTLNTRKEKFHRKGTAEYKAITSFQSFTLSGIQGPDFGRSEFIDKAALSINTVEVKKQRVRTGNGSDRVNERSEKI